MLPAMLNTDMALAVAAVSTLAYLVGSVNLSIVAARLLKLDDPRKSGSGNAGATNLLRTAGWRVAVPVLLADMVKAWAAVWIAGIIGPQYFAPAAALPLLLGNLFPIFHRFRGGKGVAAMVGATLAIEPFAMLLGGAVFLLALGISRRVSLGSLLMVASYPLWIWLFGGTQNAIITSLTVAFVILVTHRANIARILGGKEPKLGQKKEIEQ